MSSRTFRSILAVPATSPCFLEKAAQGPADAIFIDLEDAVINALKPKARGMRLPRSTDLDWGGRIVAVRVNGLGTSWGCRDILDVVEACPRLDYILLPKCGSPGDVHAVEVMIRSAEAAASRGREAGIMGLYRKRRAASPMSRRSQQAGGGLHALVFGGGDYQLDLGSFQRAVGAPSADYVVLTDDDGRNARQRHWNDLWHFRYRADRQCLPRLWAAPDRRSILGHPRRRGIARRCEARRRIGLRWKDGDPPVADRDHPRGAYTGRRPDCGGPTR